MNPLQFRTITKIGTGLAALTAGLWLVPAQAQAQAPSPISVNFTNTQTWPTPQGFTNTLLVERSTVASAVTYSLNVDIRVEAGWQFKGYDLVSLPLTEKNASLSPADVMDSPTFLAAVNEAKNTAKYSSQEFRYTGSVRDFTISPDQPLGFYYLTTGNQRSQIRFFATRIGSVDMNADDVQQAQMFYSVNVQEVGSLAAAPEPGSIALALTTLPVIGAVAFKRRRK